jgi:Rrf2 family protein
MRVSTKSYYGMLAMVYLAKQKKTVRLSSIAREEKIPSDFLEKIMQQLRKSGLVVSRQGSKGGYQLAKTPKQINSYDVISVLEGGIAPFMCVSGAHTDVTCPRESQCSTKNVWKTLDTTVNSTLKNISLADLIK